MSRHVVRSLALWLLTLPVVLVGQLSPPLVLFYVAATSYIYVGIEELGVQVEQPFDILPLWQICHLATRNVEEVAFSLSDATVELPPYNLTPPIWDSVPVSNAFDGIADRFSPVWQGR